MNTLIDAAKQALDALEYHQEQTRPIHKTIDALAKARGKEVNEFAAGCHLGNSVQGAIYKAQAKLKENQNEQN